MKHLRILRCFSYLTRLIIITHLPFIRSFIDNDNDNDNDDDDNDDNDNNDNDNNDNDNNSNDDTAKEIQEIKEDSKEVTSANTQITLSLL